MGLLIGNVDTSFIPDSVKTALDETVPMYGVLFEPDNTVGTRTYDAAGLVWQRSSNTVEGIDNFKNIAPFKTRECCRIWDDTAKTASYVYKDAYTDTEWETIRKGTHASISGDIMIEVSEFWYRRVQREDKKFEIVVAPKYKAGFKPDPWHYVNGKHYEKRYISKYMLNSEYKSLSDHVVTTYTSLDSTNISIDPARTKLKEKGMNMLTLEAYYSLVMLMLVKYATTDVQTVVGKGYSEGNYSYGASTGYTDNVKGLDGSATDLTTNESVLTLGIEDFYGSCWSITDGAMANERTIYLKDVDSIQYSPTSNSELAAWSALTTTALNTGYDEGVATVLTNDVEYDWLFIPSDKLSNDKITQQIPDKYWISNQLRPILVGGNCWSGTGAGLFAFSCQRLATSGPLAGFCSIS